MAQHPQSHVIANEVERLKAMKAKDALSELNDRITRTFQIQSSHYGDMEFRRELDFNAHLVTALRRRGVIWPQSA